MKTERHERLQEARKLGGYDSPTDAARAFGWTEPTYLGHENGSRGFSYDTAEKYAKAFKIRVEWLMTGKGQPRGEEPKNSPLSDIETPSSENIKIRELDISASAGGGMLVENNQDHDVVNEWQLPRDLLEGHVDGNSNIYMIRVRGDSMAPDLSPGQRVMVDISDKTPSPPGIFVLWDGFGLVIKRCEMVPHSNPGRVRVISANHAYSPYEVSLADAHINGRVVGKWQWT